MRLITRTNLLKKERLLGYRCGTPLRDLNAQHDVQMAMSPSIG